MIVDFLDLFEKNLKVITYSSNELKVSVDGKSVKDSLEIIGKYFEVEQSMSNIKIKLTETKIEGLYVFFEKNDFIHRVIDNWEQFMAARIIILENDRSYLIKEKEEEYSEKKKIVFNTVIYKELLKKLKNNKFFNNIKSLDNEFILVSKSNSVMHIGFLNIEARLDKLDYLKPIIDKLDLRFSKFLVSKQILINEEYIRFFIENISTIGIVKHSKEDRFFKILESLDVLISITDRDYDNYIKDFSFEKLKSKFKEERNKYFDSIDKSLESINKQALSLPLTFGATVFASYQLKDKPLISFFILVTYGLYTFIAFKSMSIVDYNLECLGEDIEREERELENTFNLSFQDFKFDFYKVKNKIKKLDTFIFCLRLVLTTLFILFMVFTFYQMFSISDIPRTLSLPTDKIKYIQVEEE